MNGPVRIAVVGCGSVAQRGILPHLAQDDMKDKVKLAATMDVVPERAKGCMEKFGAEKWYDDYDELLADADIDAVTIGTPIPLHFEQAMKAVAAGKHVHMNKTVTSTFEEANKLVEAVEKKGIKFVASPGDRAGQPQTLVIKKTIAEGTIGKPFWLMSGGVAGVSGMYGGQAGHEDEPFRKGDDIVTSVDPLWYYSPGAGPMRDRMVYELHRITGIFGPVKSVTGQSGIVVEERSFKDRTVKVTQDDNTVFILGWGGPFFGIVYVSEVMITLKSLQRFPGLGLFIKGSDGEIALGMGSVEIYSTRVPDGYRSVKTERLLQYIPPEHYRMEEAHVFNDVMHLVDCIINGKAPIVFGNTLSINHARHVVEIIDKGYEAAWTGKTQTLTSTF